MSDLRDANNAGAILSAVAVAVKERIEAEGGKVAEGRLQGLTIEAFASIHAGEKEGGDLVARYAAAVVAYLVRSRAGPEWDDARGPWPSFHAITLELCGNPLPFLVETLLIHGRATAFSRVSGGQYGNDGAPVPDREPDEALDEPLWEAAGALGEAWQSLVSPSSIIEAVHYVWVRGMEGDWPGVDSGAWKYLIDPFDSMLEKDSPTGEYGPDRPFRSALFNLSEGEEAPDLLHPLAPLVRHWLNQPKAGQWDDRATAIMPAPFAIVRDLRSAQGELFADGPIGHGSKQGKLPGFEKAAYEFLPFGRVIPLMMFDATGTLYETRGQGAPLALRLWVEAVTAPNLPDRDQPVLLEVSLRDLVRRLWPNGWTGPGRDGEKLLAALRAIDGARIPWSGSDEGWRAVSVVNPPAIRVPDSPVVLVVTLPPGSERGPLVYRSVLREYGVTSAPLYRLGLAVAYLWDQYFTRGGPLPARVPVVKRDGSGNLVDAEGRVVEGRKGKPAHWNHPKAVRTGEYMRNPRLSRIPDLRAEDLLLAAYSRADVDAMTPGMRRKALHQVRDAAHDMARRGHAVVSESSASRGTADWRIRIEPADWHGAPEAPGEPATGNAEPATGNAEPATGNAEPATGNASVEKRRET